MRIGLSRRDFIKGVGAGAAVVSVPGVLASCASRGRLLKPSAAAGAHSTYFDQFGVDNGVLRRVMEKALASGGDYCDIFLQHKISNWLGMEDETVNRAYSTIDLGAGIRVVKGDATGFAYSEDLRVEALLSAADTAAAVANGASQLRAKTIAATPVRSAYSVEVPWADIGIDKKLPAVTETDKKIRARDKRIVKVTVYLSDETSRILVLNSDGVLVEDDQPMVALYASCVAEHNGRVETSGSSISARSGLDFLGAATIDRVSREAAAYTVMLFDAVAPPVGELPVVMAPGLSGILLHEAMGHGFEADFNRKGISIYAGRLGTKIAPDFVSIADDGTNQGLRGSINIDDEGTPGQRTVLVENGVLRSYLHDFISSRHYKVASTASGRRQSFRHPPMPRMRNTYMLDGPHAPEEIIASVQKGLYAELFSNGEVNIGAGDFTFYLKHGRLIENGKLTAVVKDANLIGSGPKVLEAITMVGNDMQLFSGGGMCGKDGQQVPVGFGLPTVKAGAISIGGRAS